MTEEVRLDTPRMSSSEEMTFKTCRLAHEFHYVLGYSPIITNQKLSTGSGVHECLEAVYLGLDWHDAFDKWAEERWAELTKGYKTEEKIPAEARLEFIKAKELIIVMVEGYIEWAAEIGVDEGWEVVEVEQKHYIDVGADTILPMKFDLLLRHTDSGKLKLVDFKTAASFSKDPYTPFQLAEQTLNYAMGVLALHGQIPEVEYRQLRKVSQKGNSKPPYYRVIKVIVTEAEVVARVEEYKLIAADRNDPDHAIYSNPSACCGSWKNDYQGPCLLVHQGYTPEEAMEMSSRKYAKRDAYERYNDAEEAQK